MLYDVLVFFDIGLARGMQVKILLLSSSEYGNITSGPGVVVTNTLRYLASMQNIISALGVFRPSELFRADILPDDPSHPLPPINTVFHFMGTPYNKFKMLRGMVKISSNDEIQFLQLVSNETKNYDVALWFGSPYDPVSLKLPHYCNCPILFHINDSLFLYEKRQITKRLKNLRIWVAQQHERRILASGYAKVIYVSKEDYEVGIQLSKLQNAAKAVCLPLGVDIKTFCPSLLSKRNPDKITLLFSGTMFYQPNIDAALYLIKEIMPKIHSNVALRIAGRDPTTAIIEAAKADNRIVVTGTVHDMVAEYQAADIFVAPMISGSGIQIKILQAMSCGLPVITTSMCVKAFPETPEGILTGNNVDQIVDMIMRLISDETERRELGHKGRMFIEKKWSWEQRTDKLVRICHDVIACK